MTPTGTEQQASDRSAPDGNRPFTDILCAVDGTHRSYSAVEQAAILAGPSGHLTMLAVTAVKGSGAYRSAAIGPERAERIVERAGHLADVAGVPCTKQIDPAGPPAEVIVERAADHDLLAIGAPGTSWLGGRLVDGVAGVALTIDKPLLAARSTPGGEERFPKRILVASDGLRRIGRARGARHPPGGRPRRDSRPRPRRGSRGGRPPDPGARSGEQDRHGAARPPPRPASRSARRSTRSSARPPRRTRR